MQPALSRNAILLFTDVVGSTDIKSRFGTAAYARMLRRHNTLFEARCGQFSGSDILKHTGDGYFATFATASDAVNFALGFQADMRAELWQPAQLQTRVGIHAGEVAMMTMIGKADVIGLAADVAARVMSLAVGGQILLTRSVFDDARQFIEQHPAIDAVPDLKVRWMAHGPYRFKGSNESTDIFEVGAESFAPLRAPPDAEKARRVVASAVARHLGWRPARGQTIPNRPGWKLSSRLRSEQSEETWIGQNAQTGERRRFRFLFEQGETGSLKDIFTVQKARSIDPEPVLDSQLAEAPMFVASADVTPPGTFDEPTPAYIDRYRIIEQLGEGGMGVVYRAEQTEPVRREVAVKLIKLGMDSKEVLARFEAERQALAVMNHPCIAKVLDAGMTDRGRPYFVMEFVKGEKLTDYCDRQQLTTRQRLELFRQVCDGVQHAHSKGIIHRDIKPSNILVSVRDESAVPVIIDFGVAKATSQRLTERSLFTERGQLVGTPEYMSPEQAEMNNLDIDTRTDVYSLGVVLYELLVGALPFDPQTLRSAAYGEIQRIIREVDPPRPSTRLSSLGDRAAEVARHRRSALATLATEMRGELEWIPLKAMRKDRTERYETVRDLSRDVHNYLTEQPLLAGPESAAYRVRKFLRRNRQRVAGIAAAGIVVLATVTASFVLITQQRNAARVARDDAERARDAEATARQEAEANYQSARNAVFDFFTSVSQNELLRFESLQPLRKELLQRAVDYFSGFAKQTATNSDRRSDLAQAENVLGDAYRTLGDINSSVAALERAIQIRRSLLSEQPNVPERRIDLAAAMTNLGNSRLAQGKFEEAKQQYAAAEAMLREVTPPTSEVNSQLALTSHNQGVATDYLNDRASAEKHFRAAIEQRRQLQQGEPLSPRFQSELAQSLGALAKLIQSEKPEEAAALMAESAQVREALVNRQPEASVELRNLAESLSWLATMQFEQKNPAAAATNRRAIDRWIMLLDSPQHFGRPPAAIDAFRGLCWSQLLANDAPAAEATCRNGLKLSPRDALLQINLAHSLLMQNKDDDARRIYLQFRESGIEGYPLADYLRLDFKVLADAGVINPTKAEATITAVMKQ